MVHKNMKLNINNMKLNIVRQQHELTETHMARRLRRCERQAKFQYSEMEPTTSCMIYRFQESNGKLLNVNLFSKKYETSGCISRF